MIGDVYKRQIYMRELVPNSFITRIKLGYAYIYQDHKTETNILKSLYALAVSYTHLDVYKRQSLKS